MSISQMEKGTGHYWHTNNKKNISAMLLFHNEVRGDVTTFAMAGHTCHLGRQSSSMDSFHSLATSSSSDSNPIFQLRTSLCTASLSNHPSSSINFLHSCNSPHLLIHTHTYSLCWFFHQIGQDCFQTILISSRCHTCNVCTQHL